MWRRLSRKLCNLKFHTKQWECKKKEELRVELKAISRRVAHLYEEMKDSPPLQKTYGLLEVLVKRKMEILKIKEVAWKLKSCVQWIKEGDLNTKYFHQMANGWKYTNSIWHIVLVGGTRYTLPRIYRRKLSTTSLISTRQR